MAIVFTNAKIFLGGYDLSGDFNEVSMEYEAEALDETTFGASSRKMKGGLRSSRISGSGFIQHGAGLVDEVLFDRVGIEDSVAMLFPDGVTEGATSTGSGYMQKIVQISYTPVSGAVGELLAFDFAAEGKGVGI